jgi:hypothetical protein
VATVLKVRAPEPRIVVTGRQWRRRRETQPGRRGNRKQSQGVDLPKRGPDPSTTDADRPQNRLDLRWRDGDSPVAGDGWGWTGCCRRLREGG